MATKPPPFTAEELEQGLAVLRWGTTALAHETGVDEATARRWLRRDRPMPEQLVTWFRKLVAAHKAIRPPEAPPRRGPGRPAGGSIFAAKARD